MTVTDFTFPQNGDADFAENFGTWLGRSVITDYVEQGMTFTVDYTVPEVTISQGKAFIEIPEKTISANNETRLSLDYCIIKPETTLSLSTNSLNHIYLKPNVSTNDSATYNAYTNESNAASDSLKIGEIDTGSEKKDEDFNRAPDATFDVGSFSYALSIPVYDDSSNADNGEGNLIYSTGESGELSGLYLDDGTGFTRTGVNEIDQLDDVTGVNGLIEDTAVNRPAAGQEGRLFFDTTNERIEYDSGSSWTVIGTNPSNIGASDLGFDSVTQSELQSHVSDGDAHHSKTVTIDELNDVDLTDIEIDIQSNRPAAGTNGRLFIARDTQNVFYDNGSTWVKISTTSHDNLEDISTDDHHTRPVAGTNLSEDADQNFNLVQGSNSGLDADTVDGVELSNISVNDVSTSSFNNQYVEEGGDTMDGVLDLGNNDLEDGTTTIWDASSGYVPSSSIQSVGLNADSLDGVELSNISIGQIDTSSFDNRYVEEDGDTMGGTLTLNSALAVDMSSGSRMALPSVTSDPAANEGEIWYRSDLD